MIEKPSGWYYLRETGPYPTEDAAKEALKKHQETLRQNNEDYNLSFQQGLDFAKTKPTIADLEKFLYNCSNAMKNPATFFKAKGHADGANSYKAPSIILE
jgi:hypothetical protein